MVTRLQGGFCNQPTRPHVGGTPKAGHPSRLLKSVWSSGQAADKPRVQSHPAQPCLPNLGHCQLPYPQERCGLECRMKRKHDDVTFFLESVGPISRTTLSPVWRPQQRNCIGSLGRLHCSAEHPEFPCAESHQVTLNFSWAQLPHPGSVAARLTSSLGSLPASGPLNQKQTPHTHRWQVSESSVFLPGARVMACGCPPGGRGILLSL